MTLSIKELIDRRIQALLTEQMEQPAIGRNERRTIQKKLWRAQHIAKRFSIAVMTSTIETARADGDGGGASASGGGSGSGAEDDTNAKAFRDEHARRIRREKREQERKRQEELLTARQEGDGESDGVASTFAHQAMLSPTRMTSASAQGGHTKERGNLHSVTKKVAIKNPDQVVETETNDNTMSQKTTLKKRSKMEGVPISKRLWIRHQDASTADENSTALDKSRTKHRVSSSSLPAEIESPDAMGKDVSIYHDGDDNKDDGDIADSGSDDNDEAWCQFRKVGNQRRRKTLCFATSPGATTAIEGRMTHIGTATNNLSGMGVDDGTEKKNEGIESTLLEYGKVSPSASAVIGKISKTGTGGPGLIVKEPEAPVDFEVPSIDNCDTCRAEFAALMVHYLDQVQERRVDISWVHKHSSPDTRDLIFRRSQNPSFAKHIKSTLVPQPMRKGVDRYLRKFGYSHIAVFGAERIEGSYAYKERKPRQALPRTMRSSTREEAENMVRVKVSPKLGSIPRIETCDWHRCELAALIVFSAKQENGYCDVWWIYNNASKGLQELMLERSRQGYFHKSFLASMVEERMSYQFDQYLQSNISEANYHQMSFCGTEYIEGLYIQEIDRTTVGKGTINANKARYGPSSMKSESSLTAKVRDSTPTQRIKKIASTLEAPRYLTVPSIPTCDNLRCEFAALVLYSLQHAGGKCDLSWVFDHSSRRLKSFLLEKSKVKTFYQNVRTIALPRVMRDEFYKFFRRNGFGVVSLFHSVNFSELMDEQDNLKIQESEEIQTAEEPKGMTMAINLGAPKVLSIPELEGVKNEALCELAAFMKYSGGQTGGFCDLVWVHKHGSAALQEYIESKSKLTSFGRNMQALIIPGWCRPRLQQFFAQNDQDDVKLFCSGPVGKPDEPTSRRPSSKGDTNARQVATNLSAPRDLDIPNFGEGKEALAELAALVVESAHRAGGVCDIYWTYKHGSQELRKLLYRKSHFPSFNKNIRSVLIPTWFRSTFKSYLVSHGFQSVVLFCSRKITKARELKKSSMAENNNKDATERDGTETGAAEADITEVCATESDAAEASETEADTNEANATEEAATEEAVPGDSQNSQPEGPTIPTIKALDEIKNEIAGLAVYSMSITPSRRCDISWVYKNATPKTKAYILEKSKLQSFTKNPRACLMPTEPARTAFAEYLRKNHCGVFSVFGQELLPGSHEQGQRSRRHRQSTPSRSSPSREAAPRPDFVPSAPSSKRSKGLEVHKKIKRKRAPPSTPDTRDTNNSVKKPKLFSHLSESRKTASPRKRKPYHLQPHYRRREKTYRYDIEIEPEPGLTPEQEELGRLCVARNPRLRNIVPEWDYVREHASSDLLKVIGTSANGVRLRHFVPNDKMKVFERYVSRYREICLEASESDFEDDYEVAAGKGNGSEQKKLKTEEPAPTAAAPTSVTADAVTTVAVTLTAVTVETEAGAGAETLEAPPAAKNDALPATTTTETTPTPPTTTEEAPAAKKIGEEQESS